MPRSKRSPSRGWKKMSPKRGRERNLLYNQCSRKCFLLPSQKKFPVCPAYRKRSGRSKCKRSCKALISAYRRARQYHYPRVASKARSIARRMKCSWI